MKAELLLFSVCIFGGFCVTEGQRECYSCVYTYNEGAVGYECVNEPWNVTTANIVACPDTDDQGRTLYCHTFTQQIKDYDTMTMYIWSMLRSCQAITSEGCIDDANFRSCFSYCSDNLCNDQDESDKEDEPFES